MVLVEDICPDFNYLPAPHRVRDSDAVPEACKEVLATSESLLVPPTVLYSCTVASLLCHALVGCMCFSLGYNSGVYSIPTGIDDVLKDPTGPASTSTWMG